MPRIDMWKLAGVLIVTALSAFLLYPTFVYYSMPPAQRAANASTPQLTSLRRQALHLGLDLQGGMHLVLEVDRSKMSAAEARDAVDRAMEVLRSRIDQFGVAEPVIQREGEDRIVIQLPGLTDRQRALDLIGKTALLEFRLVRTPEEARGVFERLDAYLASHGAGAGTDSAMRHAPLTSHFLSLGSAAFVRQEDLAGVRRMLATPGLDSIVPGDSQLLWGESDEGMQGVTGQALYVLKREAEMKGGSIATAFAQVSTDPTKGAYTVNMTMTPTGRAEFARATGNYVGRQLAIVLDNQVYSAPVVQNRIPDGRAEITGTFSLQTAKDLAIVLRAGALPAPVRIIEERTVGPSLGADSIQEGLQAGLIGATLVVAFMAIYYQLSGFVAIVAMVLNIFYLIAAMVPLHATLTLPGIAGIVLTIGMSVDANVLIFERIREELRNGKTVRQAVATGYDRAFRTILDAHVTTIISGMFLFFFGTGPIRGFAITLIIGLIANMFTAVLFTRMVFDFVLSRAARVERISI